MRALPKRPELAEVIPRFHQVEIFPRRLRCRRTPGILSAAWPVARGRRKDAHHARLCSYERAKREREVIMRKWLGSTIGAAAICAIHSEALAQQRYYEWHWQMHPLWWGAWGLAMMLVMALFWFAVIAGLVLGIRWLIGKGKSPTSDRALDILRERYARGEIDKEEFEGKK